MKHIICHHRSEKEARLFSDDQRDTIQKADGSSELRHGPFYYVKQPALTTDPADVVPQDGRNDCYCWLCHREGQVLCCELCPRVYHAKCLKLSAQPEGDWFCLECEKITVAECIKTRSKAMMMLTIDQLSCLLKFALQKMKQPGTEPFQKLVSLERHPGYAEYIFHPMDLCTLEKNIKKKMYGCTEAFLADAKWILHNCIVYNGGDHTLTATAKAMVKICDHEMNKIEACPGCYLSACQRSLESNSAAGDTTATASDDPAKEKMKKDSGKKPREDQSIFSIAHRKGSFERGGKAACASGGLSLSERELVIDLGEEHGGKNEKRKLVIDLGEEHGGKDRKKSKTNDATVTESPAGEAEQVSQIMTEAKKRLELEKRQAVEEIKKKQWCANCRKEAIFYCCWNTRYCDYLCQQAH